MIFTGKWLNELLAKGRAKRQKSQAQYLKKKNTRKKASTQG